MPATARLMTHAKKRAVPVNRDELAAFRMPTSMGVHHKPVPHLDLLASIDREAAKHGLRSVHEEIAVRAGGHQMFGIMRLEPVNEPAARTLPTGFSTPGRSVALGFRNSSDQALAIGIVAGQHVFVCDNLALAGDVLALKRKNTTGLDLDEQMSEAFGRFVSQVTDVDASFNRLAGIVLTDDQARSEIYSIFENRLLPSSWFMKVHAAYFKSGAEDVKPRSRLGLYGAVTRVIREVPVATQRFEATVRISKHFAIGNN